MGNKWRARPAGQMLTVYLILLKFTTYKCSHYASFPFFSFALSPFFLSLSLYIYNLCISKCYFPSIFKKALIIPVHKKGDINNCANYRPISLLSSLCKPFEKHISRHMNIHFAKHNLFHTPVLINQDFALNTLVKLP